MQAEMVKESSEPSKKGKKNYSIEKKKALWAYIFIAFPMLYFIVSRILPTLYAFNISVHKWDLLSSNRPFVGLDNFKILFKDKVFRIAMANTVEYVLIGVPIILALSLAIALLLNSIQKGSSFYRMLVFIPYVTSTVAVSWVWRWMFMKQGGVINSILRIFNIGPQPFLDSTSQSLYVVMSNIVWQSIGFYTIILIAGLKQIPKSYYEAAQIDGASTWTQFRKITIPLLNPTIVYVAVIATIRTLQVFTQIYNITGGNTGNPGGPLNASTSLVLEIYQLAFVNYKMGMASAATVVLFIIILLITIFQMKVLTREID
ncbi:MAG: sugar ABC transporter permease [Thermotaleaceae bacterium]